ncbi:hypothetical protein RQP53_09470 [Paucibacter sp. APW11]|uniref:Uncharacterized protein n=1 Tax=Roseateles aquae TaxID=3077235 RepID=A0ABU3PAC8_9BURK|nr:hypothetical protein [Paucibacter sp. APW11]MDT8999494.1 hypothetical protein [Paucibacter sp. APW11]
MMKRHAAALGLMAALQASTGVAQTFDGRRGPIFEQPYVSRIQATAAATLLGVANVDESFLPLHEALGSQRDTALPAGVSREGERLVLTAPGRAPLRLNDFVYRGKDDAGDSQRFHYLKTLARHHLLVVEFSHDRPCFMLVDRQTLKAFFVDYGG